MHENEKYIQYLKNEMGFDGFIVSDWNSIQNTSPSTYKKQVITCVNAGVDMLMEVEKYDEAMNIIVEAVKDGSILEERVNDAVMRIIKVKMDEGIFEDPYCQNLNTVQTETGSKEYRSIAQKLVEESLVLIKNENEVLPIKESSTILVMGDAMDNAQVQCGGWTLDWNKSPSRSIEGVTTILDGFIQIGKENNIQVITDENKCDDADVIVLVVGEEAYAEWNGDTADLDLCGELGLKGNKMAIERAKQMNKPIVCCIVAGRQVLIDEYKDDWDSIVMCYLPGSEGQGVANVLYGNSNFTGKLPSPWYSSVDQINTSKSWLDIGYGLQY